jgi:hypothetical protein
MRSYLPRILGACAVVGLLLWMGWRLFQPPGDPSVPCTLEERITSSTFFGPDEACLSREQIQKYVGFALPPGARDIKSAVYAARDLSFHLRFTLERSELEDFVKSSSLIPWPPLEDCRTLNIRPGKSWWDLEPGRLGRCARLKGEDEWRELALDETDPAVVMVYFLYATL